MEQGKGREVPNISHMLMPSRSHPGEGGRASRANQTNESTCTDLTSSSQPTQHYGVYGPSQTNPLWQRRRDGDGRDDNIHSKCIIYIAKDNIYLFILYIFLFFFTNKHYYYLFVL